MDNTIEKSCSNCAITGCGMFFRNESYCSSWRCEFNEGVLVEVCHKNFEFELQGEKIGIYATGRITKVISQDSFEVKLYCNNKTYEVNRGWLKVVN